MTNVIGLTIFAVGVVLLIFGLNGVESLGAEVARFFTQNPTDRSIWLLVVGIAAVVGGLILALRSARKS